MVRFHMLGTLDLRDSQDRELRAVLRRPKLLALLGYLGVARPRGFHRRDALVALLWPELDHQHARNSLRQAVHALRSTLGADIVLARGEEELGVGEASLWCDVRAFDAALEAGEAERALELYRGGLFNGFHLSEVPQFERWLDEERERLRRRACEAAQLLADREAAAGNQVGEARWAMRLTELAQYDETAVWRLVELLDRMGDRAGAVRAYEEFERRLGRDLEVEPSSATQQLIEGIRSRRAPAGTAAPHLPIRVDPARLPRPARRRGTFGLAAVVVAGLAAGGWLLFGTPFGARDAQTTRASKSVVVLPFINMGPADQEYFANGITEEITSRLAAINGLRVIGSTSARAYEGTKKTIAEIGRELDVDYILEGSVRWQKPVQGEARVRVTPQLVSTTDGTHLWAEVYDEPLDEIFRVQGDIAQKVVRALDVTLVKSPRLVVEAAPTRNLDAYDYYLRGNDYWRRGTEQRFLRASLRMYEKAVELDSGFALGWALLARAHNEMYWMHYDRSEQRRAQAKRAVDRAVALEPDLPEAHHTLGVYYTAGSDYERGLQEYAIAESLAPNNYLVFTGRATARVRQGKVREALPDFAKASRLDPAYPRLWMNYAVTHDLLREFPRAEALYDRAIALAPDRSNPYWSKAWLYLRWDGRTERASAVLEETRAAGVVDEGLLVLTRVLVDIFDRRFADAVARLSSDVSEVIEDQYRSVPRALLYAQVYGLMSRHDLERAYYDSARTFVLKRIEEQPEDPRLHSALGIAYAGLGRKEEAIQEGLRGVELLPISKDAMRGYYREWDLARIHVMVGEHDAALDRLEYLLSIPGPLTAAWLGIDPAWDPLRQHRRFAKIALRKK